jgi:hypothetical protein
VPEPVFEQSDSHTFKSILLVILCCNIFKDQRRNYVKDKEKLRVEGKREKLTKETKKEKIECQKGVQVK